MTKVLKWLLFIALALAVLLAAVTFALHQWISTDDFRARVQAQATAALGVPVVLGSIAVNVWPLPALALGGLTLQSEPPVTLERIEVRPKWQALLQGRLEVATLVLRKAVLPQHGIDAVLLALQKKKQAAQPAAVPAVAAPAAPAGNDLTWLPHRTLLDDVTWVSESGAQTALNGEAVLGPDALPDSASLQLIRGSLQGLKASLKREAPKDAASALPGGSWTLKVEVGGGTIEGPLSFQKAGKAGSELVLQGELKTRDVEVAALTAPNKPLSGKLEASTSLGARAATTAGLVEALQTRTTFTVRDATLHGLDLARAVKTVGLNRGGETRLDALSGQVSSQGRAVELANLVASSGVLSASGNVTVSPAKALSGHVSVSLAAESRLGTAIGGAVAVPLVVSGTVDKPEVTLSRGALLGAAIGTVLMPGAGTGAGAKLGDKLGSGLKKLFGK